MVFLTYKPLEDSFLIQKYVKKYAYGSVLDMGTGTGILAKTAARNKKVKKVLAADIDEAAIAYCKNTIRSKKISFVVSNLFSNLKGTFDTIIFNPPYLPEHPDEDKDVARAVSGGKKGYELIALFLNQTGKHLKTKGNILLLFSSLTNKGIVDKLIEDNSFVFEELDTQKFFMETLYCYLIKKNQVLEHLKRRGLKNIEFLARGKRGLVYTALYKRKKVAIKIRQSKSKAQERIENEATWLKKLNKHDIGPKLLFAGKDFIVYRFVEGTFLPEFIELHNAPIIKKAIADVFWQCYQLDKIGVNKKEMHHPVKHVIVDKKPTLIDFERTHKTANPKNVTQFVQYICSMEKQLFVKSVVFNTLTLRRRAQSYKRYMDEAHLQEIIDEL